MPDCIFMVHILGMSEPVTMYDNTSSYCKRKCCEWWRNII